MTPESIWESVNALYGSGAHPAILLCVRHRGEVILDRAIGQAAPGQAARPETPACVFSASKAVTAILLHKLAEDGAVDLDQRVSHYLPEFAGGGKNDITLQQVLTHRSGVPVFAGLPANRDASLLLDWDLCVDLICRGPRDRPGLAYHAVTGGYILGEVMRRVTQKPLGQYLDETLRQPLGMRSFTYGLPAELRDEVARNRPPDAPLRYPLTMLEDRVLLGPIARIVEISNSAAFHEAVIPSVNLHATAEELSRFFQMLLDGGEYGGRRILKRETVARATRPCGRMQLDGTLRLPMRYSEGMMLGADPIGLFGPGTGSAFGHLGFMNIFGWADPRRQLAVGLLTTGKPVLGRHLLPFGRLLARIGKSAQTIGP